MLMSFYLRVLWIIICMYVCNTVKMQMKKIKIKKLVMFIFSYALFSEFLLLNCFFTLAGSTGLALKFHE